METRQTKETAILTMATAKTPEILLEARNLTIKGNSRPEDAEEFYKPVLNVLKEWAIDAESPCIITLAFSDFNTPTSKKLLDIMRYAQEHLPCTIINWYYPKDDFLTEDLQEAGEEFKDIMDIYEFNIAPLND